MTLIQGNALDELKKLESESVDCCITSPPYYALRDYKVDGQLGLEKTFQEYLDKLIEIFTQVKRVLKKTGTCWVVMGDTYGTKSGGMEDLVRYGKDTKVYGDIKYKFEGVKQQSKNSLIDKCLMMIPSRFAIQMIDSGWILRNDIIWYKPNCMPSSVKDRFTVDYEHIFFFVKSKKYYFKTQYEPALEDSIKRFRRGVSSHNKWIDGPDGQTKHTMNQPRDNDPDRPLPNFASGRIKRTVWKLPTKPFPEAHFAVFPEELVRQCIDPGCPEQGIVLDPFSGSGTTYKVALEMFRKPIGIELNPEYIDITKKRIEPYLLQMRLDV